MNHKRTTISIVLTTLMLVSLFAVISSAASVSGTVMASERNDYTRRVGYQSWLPWTRVVTSGRKRWQGTGPAAGPSSIAYGDKPNESLRVFDTWYRRRPLATTTRWTSGNWDSLGGASHRITRLRPFVGHHQSCRRLCRGSDGAVWQRTYNNGWSTRFLSAGNSQLAPALRSLHGQQVVSTSLYKVQTARCGISGGMARSGPAGNPSVGS